MLSKGSNLRDVLEVKHFKAIKEVLYDVAGISLSDHKRQMVENRISKRITALSMGSFAEYINYLNGGQKQEELIHLVNALTTNVTNFFRENHHFEHLQGEIKGILGEAAPTIRIWSAGCSIGAEPYTIAITAQDACKEAKKNGNIRILATDIDTMALARGRKGEYRENILKGLSSHHLNAYFSKHHDEDDASYIVNDNIRKMVAFNHLNLNEPVWPMSGPFDFIFCRNLLIYFDREKQIEYVTKMMRLLKPSGFLYLGHSEHGVMENQGYKICGQTIYQKPSK